MLRWEGGSSRIEAPHPYVINVTTSRKLQTWHDHIRDDGSGIRIAIRFDNNMDSVSQAWVGMQLCDATSLMAAHYKEIEDRVRTHMLGD